jgi:ABC-2 type transport system ATP-binding protein
MRAGFARATRGAARLSERRPILEVRDLSKVYAGGFEALSHVDLTIERGEIFALLGPNGAGKTTLINIVCGIANPTSGTALVAGHDIVSEFRSTRAIVGLVPQELPVDGFLTVHTTVAYSRGLFGKPRDDAKVESVLRALSLWDKKDTRISELSGGMKRRVLIAKALAHEPELLFLDEPTAGVDVELRQDTWNVVSALREEGVTVILTTHYIEEAEEMADRVGVINNGELVIVQQKERLMRELGRKQLVLELNEPLVAIPASLQGYALEIGGGGKELVYTYDTAEDRTGITALLGDLQSAGIRFQDLHTSQSSLEEIFVDLVRKQ